MERVDAAAVAVNPDAGKSITARTTKQPLARMQAQQERR